MENEQALLDARHEIAESSEWAASLKPEERLFIEAYFGEAGQSKKRAAMLAGLVPAGEDRKAQTIATKVWNRPRVRQSISLYIESHRLTLGRLELQMWWAQQIQNEDVAMSHRLKASELLGKSLGLNQLNVKAEGAVRQVHSLQPTLRVGEKVSDREISGDVITAEVVRAGTPESEPKEN